MQACVICDVGRKCSYVPCTTVMWAGVHMCLRNVWGVSKECVGVFVYSSCLFLWTLKKTTSKTVFVGVSNVQSVCWSLCMWSVFYCVCVCVCVYSVAVICVSGAGVYVTVSCSACTLCVLTCGVVLMC